MLKVIVAMNMLVAVIVFCEDTTADELSFTKGKAALRSYEQTIRKINSLVVESRHWMGAKSTGKEARENNLSDSEIIVDFQNKRKRMKIGKELFSVRNEERPLYRTEVLFIDNSYIELNYQLGEILDKGNDQKAYLSLRDKSPEEWCNDFQLYFLGSIYFDSLHATFWEIADEMEILSAREESWKADETVFFLELAKNDVHVKLWLSPLKQYVPLRIAWEQSPPLSRKRIVSAMKLDYSDFKQVSEFWVPDVASMELTFSASLIKSPDGKETTFPPQSGEGRFEYVDYKINPKLSDRDFAFSIPIPNDMKVYPDAEGKKHIKYVWLDGKVVPWTDELALARARGHGFIPGVKEPRFWMMAAGVIMILAALGIKTRNHLRRRKDN